MDLAEPGAFERLMLKTALMLRPDALVLVSSSQPDNIRRNVETAQGAALEAPARAFARLLSGYEAEAA